MGLFLGWECVLRSCGRVFSPAGTGPQQVKNRLPQLYLSHSREPCVHTPHLSAQQHGHLARHHGEKQPIIFNQPNICPLLMAAVSEVARVASLLPKLLKTHLTIDINACSSFHALTEKP